MPGVSILSHFIQDKLEISIYLSRDKFKENLNTILYFIFDNYHELICCVENSVDPDQLASSEASRSGSTLFSISLVSYSLKKRVYTLALCTVRV